MARPKRNRTTEERREYERQRKRRWRERNDSNHNDNSSTDEASTRLTGESSRSTNATSPINVNEECPTNVNEEFPSNVFNDSSTSSNAEYRATINPAPSIRDTERERDRLARRIARQSEEIRDEERSRDRIAHRTARQSEEFRNEERLRDRIAHINVRSNSPDFGHHEQQRDRERHRENRQSYEYLANQFKLKILQGPSYICVCCGGLWFRSSVKQITKDDLYAKNIPDSIIQAVFSEVAGTENNTVSYFCDSCRVTILKKNLPKLCLRNGLEFPVVASELANLSRLEEKLVAARHVFQSIWTVMGVNGQYRSKGGIVNVPVSVDTTVSSLPRSLDDTNVVHLRLARRLIYSRNYMDGNIRPAAIWNAAQYLCGKALYQRYNIHLTEDSSWIQQANEAINNNSNNMDNDDLEVNKEDDQEESEPVNPGGQETLVFADNEGLRLAPGEGSIPSSLLQDQDVEYLAFPSVFNGESLSPATESKCITYSELCKSMIRRSDRRVAKRTDLILFMDRKKQLLQISSNVQICLRKKKQNGSNVSITAGQAVQGNVLSTMISRDEAYKVFTGIRSSSEYWKGEKKKVLAMIRQFGIPTLFVTISAAEAQWKELIVILKQVVDNQIVSLDQASDLPYEEKARLIQADPVTCARYFDKRLRELKKTWVAEDGPFNGYKITHYYHRIEFQHRGSPHAHMLLWLDGAPIYNSEDNNSKAQVCSFIGSIISSRKAPFENDELMQSLLPRQTHHHTRTCKKKNRPQVVCRFNIPFYPMDETCILEPLPESLSDENKQEISRQNKKIRDYLENRDSPPDENLTFQEFLNELELTREQYILAVRSSLVSKEKIFLCRDVKDIYLNPFSEKILRLQQSNMDIQFVLDAYACCSYIVDYINKADRGLSDMLDRIYKESRENNESVKQMLRGLCSTYYNNSEVSAQEAAYNLLSLKMTDSSDQCIYINTSPPEERTHMLKSTEELQKMDQNSEKCFVPNLIDHYSERPSELNTICLAYFAAWFEYSKSKRQSNSLINNVDNTNEDELGEGDEAEDVVGNQRYIELKNHSGFIRKRKKGKVIRYRRYRQNQDEENYFRELCMLYLPWANEEEDIMAYNFRDLFQRNSDLILQHRSLFNFYDDDAVIDEALNHAEENAENREGEEEQDINAPRRREGTNDFDNYRLDDPPFEDVDVLAELGEYTRAPYIERFVQPDRLPIAEYNSLVAKLNTEQRDYLYHLLNQFKRAPEEQCLHFITGGAGTGKSLLINAIFQSMTRLFDDNSLEKNRDKPSVVLCAPTGMAAFNILGQTTYSAFSLPINQSEFTELSADVSNTMKTKLAELKLIVIDEISMVSERQLRWIDKRLRDLFGTSKVFGGVSVIAVGDLNQLPPVMGLPVYSSSSESVYIELFGTPLWHMFSVHRLSTIMRQREDVEFAVALNNMASGNMTAEDIELMRSRVSPTIPEHIKSLHPLYLFHANADVSQCNEHILQEIDGESAVSEASDVASSNQPNRFSRVLDAMKNKKPQDTNGLAASLFLKVGGRYMMTNNLDTADGLVNGALGYLRKIDFGIHVEDSNMSKPSRVWIEFIDSRSGRNLRQKSATLTNRLNLPSTWTPVVPYTAIIHRRPALGNLQVSRTQFPLLPAEALTIHKSQGGTYDNVVLHCTGRRLQRSLLYVACSRATSASGLHIVGKFEPPSKQHEESELDRELKRQETVSLVPRFQFLHNSRASNMVQLIFHNIQSLRLHQNQIATDQCYLSSDFILLAETWTLLSDVIDIPSFSSVCRVNCPDNRRRAYGCCCLVNNDQLRNVDQTTSVSKQGNNYHISFSYFVHKEKTLIVSGYASPNSPATEIIQLLEPVLNLNLPRKLLAADLNANFLVSSSKSRAVSQFLELYGMSTVLNSPSTIHGTQIDAIFTSFPVESAGNYICTTQSPHDPLYVRYIEE